MRNIVQERSYATGILATGRLDLDHIGPQVGHQLPTELPSLVGQLQHAQSRQGSVGGFAGPCVVFGRLSGPG